MELPAKRRAERKESKIQNSKLKQFGVTSKSSQRISRAPLIDEWAVKGTKPSNGGVFGAQQDGTPVGTPNGNCRCSATTNALSCNPRALIGAICIDPKKTCQTPQYVKVLLLITWKYLFYEKQLLS
ncbi:hypothetical protein PtA15_15A221 [Puccinia triticina]|uniref:Uncharacterized protein n=1 Tax=Puccinia triticina TaxID=208348 RepID=A0ABY7D2I8_9BASI|nr:uncharacterized protein PtA15_15A221 [Puccinia triticina]WAQ91829.1 hypothetical protein PtA15_15A221 [Puccinia triticina]